MLWDIHTGHLYPQEVFLVLISLRCWVDPRATVKNSSGAIGNRTRDLPFCSPVPQPTALRRVQVSGTSRNDISGVLFIYILNKQVKTEIFSSTKLTFHFLVLKLRRIHHITSGTVQQYRTGRVWWNFSFRISTSNSDLKVAWFQASVMLHMRSLLSWLLHSVDW